MEHIGIDVHKNQSQLCILTSEGELIEKRIVTERGRFMAMLGSRPRARILIEASTESEWVARCLEGHGHEVIVADPNYLPMYGHRNRRVKTDRRDARALADACRNGTYRSAHRTSDARRHLRGRLAAREALVRTRARYISLIRALLRREGLRVRSGASEQFIERLAEVEVPTLARQEIEPLLAVMDHLDTQIALADLVLTTLASEECEIRRLCTVPGVGPVTAASVVATLDTATRFRGAHQVEAYLGLVPRERSSGEKQHKGRITKSGNNRTRYLLVEAAWVLLSRVNRRERSRYKLGPNGSQPGAANGSPWWPWRGGWPGSSTQSCATGRSLMRGGSWPRPIARASRHRSKESVLDHPGNDRSTQPVRKYGCGKRDVALGRNERPSKRWRCPPTESPQCAGDQSVALVEREQKDEEPR